MLSYAAGRGDCGQAAQWLGQAVQLGIVMPRNASSPARRTQRRGPAANPS